MTQFTANEARKLLKETKDKENFNNKIQKLNEAAEIVVASILEDIEKAIREEKKEFIMKNLKNIKPKSCIPKIICVLQDLGFILSSEDEYFINNFDLKISWGKDNSTLDGQGGVYIYAYICAKRICQSYNQYPYSLFHEYKILKYEDK